MELRREPLASYDIPDDCVAKIEGRKVNIYRKIYVSHDILRCATCKHRIMGKTFINQISDSMVCELRPKKVIDKRFKDQQLFYSAQDYKMACDKYEE